jgi:hypothetical protein
VAPIEGDTDCDGLVAQTEERVACSDRNPVRNVYFGDLHVHTTFSFDAGAYNNVLRPEDAYAFARGQALKLPPLDETGQGTRTAKLAQPLDFTAVTDHGEFLGEIGLCTTPGSASYDSPTCVKYRDPEDNGAFQFGSLLADPNPIRLAALCGEDGTGCEGLALQRWGAMQAAAEAAYDRSESCAFTSFVAYEYTNTELVSNLHRNVVFRNTHVPLLPVTYYEAPEPQLLWETLDSECHSETPGCEVLVIPHNSNLSNGRLFAPTYPEDSTVEEEASVAALRQRMEPLAEIFQHKGASECRIGFDDVEAGPDALCDFELLRGDSFLDCGEELGFGGMRLAGCLHRLDFLRNVLREGLAEEKRLGVNPYRLGLVGSTDTHNATPGMVDSVDFPGHIGNVDDTPLERLGYGNITHDGIINNPGGLTAVWAVENSRDALFEAMRRREVYATSGPRMSVRFFGGWGLSASLCETQEGRAEKAYAQGVPMGGVLPGAEGKPTLAVWAEHDAGTGVLLERIQIIKGWVDAQGQTHEKVVHVAGNAESSATVDDTTCVPDGQGYESLCGVWTDEAYSAGQSAFYYARVVEVPSCRWSTRKCNAMPAGERPGGCSDPAIPRTVQQRAVSSPIWIDG